MADEFSEAMEKLSRDDRFKATVYAMNTLLIQRGVYTQREFEAQFVQWAKAHLKGGVLHSPIVS